MVGKISNGTNMNIYILIQCTKDVKLCHQNSRKSMPGGNFFVANGCFGKNIQKKKLNMQDIKAM